MKRVRGIALFVGLLLIVFGMQTYADNLDTWIDESYVAYINKVCDEKGLCPEFVEALVEAESSGKAGVVSSGGCVGLTQMSPSNRFSAGKNLYDPYQNIDAGTDFLIYLFEKYSDPGVVLVAYNTGEHSQATKNAINNGELNAYAKKILKRAETLERVHGK